MITVPSGDTEVRTSFSGVPRTADARSLAKNMCGTQSASRNTLCPTIGALKKTSNCYNMMLYKLIYIMVPAFWCHLAEYQARINVTHLKQGMYFKLL